jgi:hypothetical protein
MLEQIWQFLTEKLAGLVPYISPFYYEYAPWGILIIAVCILISYLFPPVRSLAGAVVLSVIAFLVGMWKGEGFATERYKKDIARLKAQRQNQKQPRKDWWRW